MLASETPRCLTFKQKTLNRQYSCLAPFIFQYLTKLNWGFLKTDLGHTFERKDLTDGGRAREGTGRDLRVSELAAVLSSYVNISRYYVYSVQENVHVSRSCDRRFRALRVSILNDILYISLNCKLVLVHNRSPEHGLLRYYPLFLQGELPKVNLIHSVPPSRPLQMKIFPLRNKNPPSTRKSHVVKIIENYSKAFLNNARQPEVRSFQKTLTLPNLYW